MKHFNELDAAEKEMLLKFPAYISLLAANNDYSLNEKEKKEASKFCHIKTYTCHPLLQDFYREAEKVFDRNIEELDRDLPKGKEERETAIKSALSEMDPILHRLGEQYALIMHKGMRTFKDHVSKAHFNILESLIFPLPNI